MKENPADWGGSEPTGNPRGRSGTEKEIENGRTWGGAMKNNKAEEEDGDGEPA